MKVKTISRSADNYVPVRNTQELALPRNLDPALHPFERAREYTRALTATKMERMFAQPFVGQLGRGHVDGVYLIARDPKLLRMVALGSGDGSVKVWDALAREEHTLLMAHHGMVSGLVVSPQQQLLLCGADKTIKVWDVNAPAALAEGTLGSGSGTSKPLKTFLGGHLFQLLDHHRLDPLFVTGGALIELWDMQRSKPTTNLTWGCDNITAVRFNKLETNVLALAGADRLVVLYDLRTNSSTQKLVTLLRTNAICWSPTEPFNFATACEDHNAYLWDMRKLTRLLNVYQDHVAAVMDVDFSPTGEELVTLLYDKTVRIFRTREGHLRDIYHTKRMQRVFVAKFLNDAQYVFSGSDDGNVRVWRAQALQRLAVRLARERAKLEYNEALKQRYRHMPEIRRIARHRHLPVAVKKAGEIKREELDAVKRREDNRRRHSKPGLVPYSLERTKHVVGVAHQDEE